MMALYALSVRVCMACHISRNGMVSLLVRFLPAATLLGPTIGREACSKFRGVLGGLWFSTNYIGLHGLMFFIVCS